LNGDTIELVRLQGEVRRLAERNKELALEKERLVLLLRAAADYVEANYDVTRPRWYYAARKMERDR
jgi:hypothetical protein